MEAVRAAGWEWAESEVIGMREMASLPVHKYEGCHGTREEVHCHACSKKEAIGEVGYWCRRITIVGKAPLHVRRN
jgi:hypothetical protein